MEDTATAPEKQAPADLRDGTPVTFEGKPDTVKSVFLSECRVRLQLFGGKTCWAEDVQIRIIEEVLSPRPWRAAKPADSNGYAHVRDAKGRDVATCWGPENSRMNAEHIAHAVNHYDDLVEILRNATDTFADFERASRILGRDTLAEAAQIAKEGCKAILARAEGKG